MDFLIEGDSSIIEKSTSSQTLNNLQEGGIENLSLIEAIFIKDSVKNVTTADVNLILWSNRYEQSSFANKLFEVNLTNVDFSNKNQVILPIDQSQKDHLNDEINVGNLATYKVYFDVKITQLNETGTYYIKGSVQLLVEATYMK